MTLRNAFGDLPTVEHFVELLRQGGRGAQRPARTSNNADRVNVENTVNAIIQAHRMWDQTNYVGWWSSASTNNTDTRQHLLEQTRTSAILARQRWTFS